MWPGPNDPPISVNSEFLKEKLRAARGRKSPLVKGLSQGPSLVKTQPIACAGLQPRRMKSHNFPSLLALVLGPKSLSLVFRTLRPWPNS